MPLITRCTYWMALRIRQIHTNAYFFCNNPTIVTLLKRGWVRSGMVRQYELTDEGLERLCEWEQNKRHNYRHIALHNAIYKTGNHRSTGESFYYPAPGEKHAGEQVALDNYIIGGMINDGELVYSEADNFWYAEHSTEPGNRTHGICSDDLSF